MSEKPVLVVTSQSEIKLSAVKDVFPGYEVIGVKTPSRVEQPFGLSEITDCLIERASFVFDSQEGQGHRGDLISIENGIIELNGQFLDICRVGLFRNRTHFGFFNTCPSDFYVEFPQEAVRVARQIGFDTTTVGSVLSQMYPGCNSKDPHTYLTGGKITRRLQIISALQPLKKHL